MPTEIRRWIVVSCLTLVAAAACGGGPTKPSGANGATIAGTVQVNGGALTLGAPNAAGTLTVTIEGTSLSATVDSSGYFQLAGVPTGNVRLRFSDAIVNATVEISNVGDEQLIEVQVEVSGNTATVVNEVRTTSKVSLCHRTESGTYHLVSVSESAEPAHREHGDAKVGEALPDIPTMKFDENCKPVGPAVRIEKSTNGEDADEAPGPSIAVGSQVIWRYVVTNIGTVPLTNIVVTDNRGVNVTCPMTTTLNAGQSITCTGSGVAVQGQYSNIGTVTASSTTVPVTDDDASHYLGVVPGDDDDDGPKVSLCHRTGNGSYHLITISVNAEPAHRAHGDAKIGESVPNSNPPKTFGPGCSLQ